MKIETIKVHLADDHQLLIDGMIAVLKNEETIEIVGTSLDGKSVLDWFDKHEADVLILDIGMPVLDGIQVLRSLQSREKKPNVVVLTSYDEIKLIKEVLKLGAMGFITKVSAGENIIEAIKSLQKNEHYFSKDIRSIIVNSFTGTNKEKNANNEIIKVLSDREYEILILLAQDYSHKEIADQLFIAPTTVDTHKKNIMTKLGIKNPLGLAMYVVKNKLIE